jgi:hypothetical protein
MTPWPRTLAPTIRLHRPDERTVPQAYDSAALRRDTDFFPVRLEREMSNRRQANRARAQRHADDVQFLILAAAVVCALATLL